VGLDVDGHPLKGTCNPVSEVSTCKQRSGNAGMTTSHMSHAVADSSFKQLTGSSFFSSGLSGGLS
jgi:hypothetical protein